MVSRSLLSNVSFNNLQVNKLQVNNLQVQNQLIHNNNNNDEEDKGALIHYTVVGNGAKFVKYLKEDDNLIYYEVILNFDELSHIAPTVINSKHGHFYDIFETKQLFMKIINGFKIHGRNFNLDSIANENLPTTTDNKSNDGSKYNMAFIYINQKYEKILLPCSIYHIDLFDSDTVKMIFYVNDNGIIKNNQSQHGSYNSRDPHYHTFPAYKISNTNGSAQSKIDIPRENIMMLNWTVNIYLWFPGMFALIGAAIAVAAETAAAVGTAVVTTVVTVAETAAAVGTAVVSSVAEVSIAAASTAAEIASATTDAIATALVTGGEALESAMPGLISQAVETAAAQAGSAVSAIVSQTVDAVAGPIVGTMIDTITEVGVDGAINLAADGLSTAIENIAEDGIVDFIESMTDEICQKVAQDAAEAAIKKAIKKSIEKLGTDYLKNLVQKEAEEVNPTLGSLVDILNSGTSTDLNDWLIRGKDIRDIVNVANTQIQTTNNNNIANGNYPTLTEAHHYVFAHTYNTPNPTLDTLTGTNRDVTLIKGFNTDSWNFVKAGDDPYLWEIVTYVKNYANSGNDWEKLYLHNSDSVNEPLIWLSEAKHKGLNAVDNLRSVWKVSRNGPLGYSIKNESTLKYLYFSKLNGNEYPTLNLCNKKQLSPNEFQEFLIYKKNNANAMLSHLNLHFDGKVIGVTDIDD